MTDLLIYADSIRSPDMRHEVPLPVPDPFLYVEHGGTRTVVCSAFEIPRIAAGAPEIETLSPEAFGVDELLASGTPRDEAELECYLRACQRFEVTSAAVPPSFPLELADHLRANGIDLYVDRELFEEKRRAQERAAGRGPAPRAEGVRGGARHSARHAAPRGRRTASSRSTASR